MIRTSFAALWRQLRWALAIGLLAASSLAAPVTVNLNDAQRYRFKIDHKTLVGLERNIAGIILDESTSYDEAVVWATPTGLANLQAAGIIPIPAPLPTPTEDEWTAYPTIPQIVDSLRAINLRHPQSTHVDTIGFSGSHRPLVAITIGNNISSPDFNNKPAIMLISTVHGNEKPGTPILINFANWLLDSSNVDPRLARMLSECRVYLLPLFNPDGYTTNTRGNAAGIDINRNFPCKTPLTGGVWDSLDSPTGRAVETQVMMAWTHAVKPMLALNFHTGATVVNYPLDSDLDGSALTVYPLQPDKKWFIAAADSYAVHNAPLYANNTSGFHHGTVNGAEWYQITGGLQDYQYRFHNCRHMTIELCNQQPPPIANVAALWNENKFSILAYCSLIWQGVDVTVSNATAVDTTTYGDLGFGTPHYVRLGSLPSFRFLLPPGTHTPRIYHPYNGSTWQDSLYPIVNSNEVSIAAAALHAPVSGTLGIRNTDRSLHRYADSVLCSPYEDAPEHWFNQNAGGGSGTIDSSARYNLNERNWLLQSYEPDGFYFPLLCDKMAYHDGEVELTTVIDTVNNFSDSQLRGTGTALQYTDNGRDGGGASDSPTGNYTNNLNNTYTFGPYPLQGNRFEGYSMARFSFSYTGNMEKGGDYWILSVQRDNGPFVAVDTLTGIFPDWQVWYNDLPTDGITSLSFRITVHSDGSVVRDGYTMDDLTLTESHVEFAIQAPEARSELPHKFALSSYPNPFNNSTRISLSLPEDGVAKLALFDLLGREVAVLQNGWLRGGTHTFSLNGTTLAAGVYFLRAQQGNRIHSQKIALVK